MEILNGDTLVEADTDAIEIGDIVDVPVWMDVWNGPADLNVDPWTLTSFDRLIIVEKKTKTVSNILLSTSRRPNICITENVTMADFGSKLCIGCLASGPASYININVRKTNARGEAKS